MPARQPIVPPAVQLRSQPEDIEHQGLTLVLQFRVFASCPLEPGLGPDTFPTYYCLPLTSNVIGGAEKPEPTLIFYSSSSVASS
jgi:hypothetical protein